MLFGSGAGALHLCSLLVLFAVHSVNAKVAADRPQIRSSAPPRAGAGWDRPRKADDESAESAGSVHPPPPPTGTTIVGAPASEVELDHEVEPVIRHSTPTHRILAIYTGGTLGMVKKDGTWAPPERRGTLAKLIDSMSEFHDDGMPDLDMIEYEPLLDSSNIGPSDWVALAKTIAKHYYDYDGFVVIHGTDTMAYTASALSFMLEGLGKAVVITGSIIALREPFNDARRNLIASIMFASQLDLAEVCVFFNDKLLRGNRAIKSENAGLDAFSSPNYPILASIGASGISCHNRHQWLPPPVCRLRLHTNLDARVLVLRLTPGFDDSTIAAMVTHASQLRALVLSLYGTGNGPSHKSDFMDAIAEAIRKDILVVVVTQCPKGTVSLDTYEVGRRLLEIGVVSASDMTHEACVTKIAYLCGRGLTGAMLRSAMGENLRGELTGRAERAAVVAVDKDMRL